MTWELICDACGKVIPMGINFIEYKDPVMLIFCNEDCEDEYNRS